MDIKEMENRLYEMNGKLLDAIERLKSLENVKFAGCGEADTRLADMPKVEEGK